MALDRQMILSELGSVMNKLQSADCGCMGKIFSSQGGQRGQGGSPMCHSQPSCGRRQGCCHGHGCGGHNHGYSACAGEPNTMNGPCMGMQCNPPKLYSDTYSYLNQNLMQPVVKEVYEDLKSINPDNSVVNNPMATQMGLQQPHTGVPMLGNMGTVNNQMPSSDRAGMQSMNMPMNQQVGGQQINNPQTGQMTQMMGGMGPNIVNLMNADSKNSSGQPRHMTEPMVTSTQHGQVAADISHGHYKTDMNAANYRGQHVQRQFSQQPNVGNTMNLNSQSIMGSNQNSGIPNASYQINDTNSATRQMATSGHSQNYGQHTQGVTKFNEMFPGVMQGGDLGFDPMAIAMQMNPANQQQIAMNQMHKLMDGNKVDRIFDPSSNVKAMQPAITGANAAAAAVNQPPRQEMIPPHHQQAMPVQQGNLQYQQQDHTNVTANQPYQVSQQGYGYPVLKQQPQVYTSLANEAMPINQNQGLQQHQQGQIITDLNAQAMQPPNLPTLYEGVPEDPHGVSYQQSSNNTPQQPLSDQQMIQERILPVDTSKNQPPQMRYQKQYEYNTLGQPVEMLPARMYHQTPDTSLPQTLSPQPVTKFRTDLTKFNVKPTVSKTSLMGSRPVGRTPSRNQLQQIYNQYKGSHSHTQQNIKTPAARGTTFSEGKLNVTAANTNQHRQMPVERVAGDTLANNQIASNPISNKGQPGHIGDVPADNKPHGDVVPAKDPQIKKCRNGLQDMVYTSYPTSAAWSFHGNRVPYSPVHRYRNRA